MNQKAAKIRFVTKIIAAVAFLIFFIISTKSLAATLILSGKKIQHIGCPAKAEIRLESNNPVSAVDLQIKYDQKKLKIL